MHHTTPVLDMMVMKSLMAHSAVLIDPTAHVHVGDTADRFCRANALRRLIPGAASSRCITKPTPRADDGQSRIELHELHFLPTRGVVRR